MSRTYTYDEAFAAMCIIEEIIDPMVKDMPAPWEPWRSDVGIAEVRGVVLDVLAPACDAAFTKAYAAWERSEGRVGDNVQDPGSFDYDFVPAWLRVAVDWSGSEPRVIGAVCAGQSGCPTSS